MNQAPGKYSKLCIGKPWFLLHASCPHQTQVFIFHSQKILRRWNSFKNSKLTYQYYSRRVVFKVDTNFILGEVWNICKIKNALQIISAKKPWKWSFYIWDNNFITVSIFTSFPEFYLCCKECGYLNRDSSTIFYLLKRGLED